MLITDGKIYSERMMGYAETPLVSMSHAWLDNHWRVPIYKQEIPHAQYTVYVGKDFTRIYTDMTIPDYVQSKITMANASKDPIFLDYDVMTPIDVFNVAGYVSNHMQEVAWRVSPSLYVVVLNKVEFNLLRGE